LVPFVDQRFHYRTDIVAGAKLPLMHAPKTRRVANPEKTSAGGLKTPNFSSDSGKRKVNRRMYQPVCLQISIRLGPRPSDRAA
jgi:hypothetical protein